MMLKVTHVKQVIDVEMTPRLNLSVNVIYPSSITHIIHDRIVNETDVVQLNCTADGNPPPKIRWTRVPDNNPVSKVLNITGKQDEGLYRCTAENGVGNVATKDVNITVLCKSNS